MTNRQKTQVLTYFNKSYSSKSENSDEQLEKAILSIIDNPAKRLAVPEYGYDAYTFYVPFNRDDRFGNLTLQVVNDTVIAGYFTLYEMTENYAERFNRNAASITQFEGKVRSVRLDKFLRLLGKWSGAKNEDEDCFVYAFDGPDSHEASPGSGSGSGGSSDDSGSNTGDPVGGDNTGGSVSIGGQTPAGESDGGGSSGDSGSGGESDGGGDSGANSGICDEHVISDTETQTVIARTYCDGTRETVTIQKHAVITYDEPAPRPGDHGVPMIRASAKAYEDCVKLLRMAAIVPRSLHYQSLSERLEDRISLSVANTPFNLRAVLSIIDVAEYEDCYLENNADGVCIAEQVANYLDQLVGLAPYFLDRVRK